MADKKSFMLYFDYREHLALLSDSERGALLMALLDYGERGEVPQLSGASKMAFSFIRAQIDRDNEKYEKTVERRSAAGKQGGRPTSEESKAKQDKAKKANAFSEKQSKAKKADTVTDTGTVTVTVTDTDTGTDIYNGGNKAHDESNQDDDVFTRYHFTENMTQKIREWIAYKNEKRQGYKTIGLKNMLTEIQNNADAYGESAVIELISNCMASNWQGIAFDKLKTTKQQKPGKQSNNPFWELAKKYAEEAGHEQG